ncbi:MAG: T9SS type A sorting domain-containing protein [Bacteroidales bacterium]
MEPSLAFRTVAKIYRVRILLFLVSIYYPVASSAQILQSEESVQYSTRNLLVDGKVFHFLGGFVPGWHFGLENFTSGINQRLLHSAKENGINALHIMLPQFEKPRSTYIEEELVKLDSFIYLAGQEGIYILPEILQGIDIAQDGTNPYYHPQGIQGIIQDPVLRLAFKNRLGLLVNRVNTISGIAYKDDPAIMAWILVGEPLSAPWNYSTPPTISLQEFKDWVEEMAAYTKSIDTTHLVTIFTTGGIGAYWTNWTEAFDAPSLDFNYAEDAEMRIVNYFPQHKVTDYPLPLRNLNKPLLIGLSFTSGDWNSSAICGDTLLQANLLSQALPAYTDSGACGQIFQSWGVYNYVYFPEFARCFNYNSSMDSICRVFRHYAQEEGTFGWPPAPLKRVVMEPAGVKDHFAGNSVRAYPNPTTGWIGVYGIDVERISVFSMEGKKMLESRQAGIDLSPLTPGIYLFTLEKKDGTFTFLKVLRSY